MALTRTEEVHPAAQGIDTLPGPVALGHLLAQQAAALAALAPALPAIEDAAHAVARAWTGGGRIAYAGAGSSALMAVADGMELPGTYGLSPDRILLCMAGGLPVDARMPGGTEDDADAGAAAARALRRGDAAIVVAASGSTPYALGFARAAKAAGAAVIGIANNRGAPLLALADVAVCLETPPEVIAGSTRMGAGTAQKACLNLISTRAAILSHLVHDGMMVAVVADNAKLQGRAAGIVARIAGCDAAAAERALAAAGMEVRPAVLVARGMTPAAAAALLARHGGHLRAAMDAMTRTTGPATATAREETGNQRETT